MKFNKYDFKVSDVCWCSCHKINTVQLDMFSCCSLSGKKYLDEDGKLIVDTYIKLMENNEKEKSFHR